ncbi:MAG: ABC transporter permease [Anaerolineae bacterium]|nr:ABC transporter permease [Anaerolineae bacterium]
MRYLLRRLFFYLIAAAVAITLNFLIPRMMTGNPADIMFARYQGRLDVHTQDAMRKAFGFVDGPLPEQFASYVQNLAQGNLGISVSAFPLPVGTVIGSGFGWTLRLIGIATILSFVLGVFLGVLAAWRRGRFLDSFILPTLSIMGAFPYFFVALIALYVLALSLNVFPLGHAFDVKVFTLEEWNNPQFLTSVVQHAMLPALTILITSIGGWMLGMRNNMIGVLSQDYIVMAQAKGLSDQRIMFSYAARNAVLPSLTAFAMNLAFIVGGALLVEVVFSYPGVGYLLLQAVNNRDYPLMQGIFLMITIAILIANFLVDIAYTFLDPRTR